MVLPPDEAELPTGRSEGHVTWSPNRTIVDRLRGRNKLTATDPSVADLKAIATRLDGASAPAFDLG